MDSVTKDRPRFIQRISSALADIPAKTFKEIGLSRAAVALLKTLVCFAGKRDVHAKIHASQQTLCQRTGYGRTIISQSFNRLIDLGLIEREQQRKIGHDTWSSPAFWFTKKFVDLIGSMCSVFERTLTSHVEKNIKESTLIKTRHGIHIQADAVECRHDIESALNSMSKAKLLHLLKVASASGVKIQHAIDHITRQGARVRDWYRYLTAAINNGPIDYKALTAKQKQKHNNIATPKYIEQRPQRGCKEKAKTAINAAFAILRAKKLTGLANQGQSPSLLEET